MRSIIVLAALAVAMPLQAGDKAPPKVVAFNASVKVDVDAAGKPVKVEAPADLPEAIRGFIEKRVAAWQYQPAKHDGTAVPATTYVKVGACAIPTPAGDAFQLGVDYKGNGPRIANKYDRLMPPMYPVEAQRRGQEGSFTVVLDVKPDGSAQAASITSVGTEARRGDAEFEATLRKWGRSHRFEPEIVAGQPVATKVQVVVDFTLGDSLPRQAWKQKLQEQALKTSECQLASGGPSPGLEAVALDSPVKVTPAPAS